MSSKLLPILRFSISIFVVFITLTLFGRAAQIQAQQCAPQRVIIQFACVTNPGTCTGYVYRCSLSLNDCSTDQLACGAGETCNPICTNVSGDSFTCGVTGQQTVNCSSPPSCQATGVNIRQCSVTGANSDSCLESFNNLTYGCWINGAPASCPAGYTDCGNPCGCQSNSQSCAYWTANNCGNTSGGGGGGGGGACSSGDCFPGISNCGQVGRQTQTGTCNGGSGLCCAFAGGGGGCQLEVRNFPNTIHVGETLPWVIFERGGVGNEGFFSYSWDALNNWPSGLATITPMSQGGTATYTGTIRGNAVGFTKVRFATRIDWTRPIICATERNITILPAACTPSCTAACGQADGCGGTCGITSVGAPATPANLQPNGPATPVGGIVTVSWSPSARATAYQGEIYPVGTSCSDPSAICGTTAATSYPYPVGSASTYTLRVRAVNSACTTVTGTATTYSAWAQVNFTLGGAITGNFYLDNNRTCSVGGATPLQNLGGGTVTVTDRNSITSPATLTAGSVGYTAAVPYWTPGGNNIVTVRPGVNPATGVQLTCACNANGSDTLTCIKSGINSPQGGVNFFLTDRLPVDAWYQVVNGSIYAALNNAGGTGIKSYVPINCTAPGCAPFVLKQNAAATADSAGIGVTGGGAIDTDVVPGNSRAKLTQRTPSTVGAIGPKMVKREDYAYFARLYDVVSTDNTAFNDFDGSPGRPSAANATKPGLAPRSGKKGYITSGDLTISQPWIVNSNEKIVVFVPGNLTINDPASVRTLITVAQGGFLGFIVQGNIVIGNDVGYPSPYNQSAPNIEGLYVANGTMSTSTAGAGTDLKLIGAGNFVAWGGFSFQRDLGLLSGFNETVPAESFSSRPDLVKNVPLQMTNSSSSWQEIN